MLLNKRNFDVARFAATDQSRYTMQAIRVTAQGTCATDGHRLVMVSAPSCNEVSDKQFPHIDGFEPFNFDATTDHVLLPAKDSLAISKAIPKSRTIPILNYAALGKPNGTLNFAVTDLATTTIHKPISGNGQFPNVDMILGEKEPVFTISVDAGYLAEMAKAVKDFGSRCVTLKFTGPMNAVRMEASSKSEDGQTWTGLLMPCRV